MQTSSVFKNRALVVKRAAEEKPRTQRWTRAVKAAAGAYPKDELTFKVMELLDANLTLTAVKNRLAEIAADTRLLECNLNSDYQECHDLPHNVMLDVVQEVPAFKDSTAILDLQAVSEGGL
jgi:hypothetical protein